MSKKRKAGNDDRPLSYERTITIGASVAVFLGIVILLFLIDEFIVGSHELSIDPNVKSEELVAKTEATKEAFNQWVLNENIRIFRWHARSTKVIFWMSILISATGMGFAFWQFSEASHSERVAEKADVVEVKSQFVSLAFKSRSLATFMVSVSLAYFLIYVTLVYPVETVESGVTMATKKAEADSIASSESTATEDESLASDRASESEQQKEPGPMEQPHIEE